ncbi:MAG: hypothetical protein LBR83_04075, partial [Clostridiales bacterium]|nr:hypothetical protein [Clostridiales bacterium]
MSAPELPNGKISLTREQALNAIITSIAMEETALSQLINAEGEKIKYAIDYIKKNYDNHNLQKFLEVNESASSLLDTINAMQVLLKSKLHTALNHLPPSAGQNPSDSPCAAPGSRHARRPSKPAEAPIPVKPRPRSAHTAPNPPLPSVSAFPVVIEYAWSSGATLPLDEDRHGCG